MSAQPHVVLTRVEAWLKKENLAYGVSDGSIHTGFDSCMMVIQDHGGDFLRVCARWRGTFEPGTDSMVMAYADSHNARMYGPRAYVDHDDDNRVCLTAEETAFTTEGMSDAQLDDFLNTAFATLLSFYSTVAEDFPALVTWDEED